MNEILPMSDALNYLLDKASKNKKEIEVLATERKSTGISFHTQKLDQFSFSETHQIGVRVIDGDHEGVAFSESLSTESLDSLFSDALSNSKMIKRDWISHLHDGSDLPQMDGIYNAELEQVPVENKIQAAKRLESLALEHDKRITNVTATRYGDSCSQVWIANTRGLHGTYKTNSCYGVVRCLAKDDTGNVMSGEVDVQRRFDSLNIDQIAKRGVEKTVARMGATRPKTGRYTVVFENRVAEDLLSLFASYFSAKAVDEKTSPLAGKLNQKVFSEHLNLIDDPFISIGMSSRPFDDEGYISQKTQLIKDGVLTNFLTNSVLARKLNLPHTKSASRSPSSDLDISSSNLVVSAGKSDLQSLLNSDSKVILISDVLGHAGFRRNSGDFSLPFEGDLFENGKRQTALKDFLISGNILQVFSQIEAVGNDVLPPVGSTISPSLLVRDLNVAGQS